MTYLNVKRMSVLMKLMFGKEQNYFFGDIKLSLHEILIYSAHSIEYFFKHFIFKIVRNFIDKFLIIKDRIFNETGK